nr:uncharacterized protein LOC124813736 [Hydra vulgaris]
MAWSLISVHGVKRLNVWYCDIGCDDRNIEQIRLVFLTFFLPHEWSRCKHSSKKKKARKNDERNKREREKKEKKKSDIKNARPNGINETEGELSLLTSNSESQEDEEYQPTQPWNLYHIYASSDGQVECITWTTTEQIMLLQKFLDVNNLSMPLSLNASLAVVDQHGMGRPVVQSIVYREDQAHLRMFLIRSQEWAGFNTFLTSIFVIDMAQAEISVLQVIFIDNRILLCRFHVSKAFVHKIKKSNLISNDKESLYKATKRLLYGNQQTCNEALLNIQETFPEFYLTLNLTNNWLMMADMFMGYRRKGLLHIDNHTNNRLERYHRTLKDVGLTSRMSPGNLISKIIKVNRVQLEKSKHADFDQRLKINTKLPECLKFYAHTISSFILQHMVEQYNLSQKEGYSLQEENNCLQVRYNDCLFPLHNWTCQCDNATGYGVPCSHAFFTIIDKNMNLPDLDSYSKRH